MAAHGFVASHHLSLHCVPYRDRNQAYPGPSIKGMRIVVLSGDMQAFLQRLPGVMPIRPVSPARIVTPTRSW